MNAPLHMYQTKPISWLAKSPSMQQHLPEDEDWWPLGVLAAPNKNVKRQNSLHFAV